MPILAQLFRDLDSKGRNLSETMIVRDEQQFAINLAIFAQSPEKVKNKYPPAEPEVLRLLPPQMGLTAIESQKHGSR